VSKFLFDPDLIATWDRALDDRPSAVAEIELPSLPQIEAFTPTVLNAGMAIRFRDRDGGEHAFLINPVAARHLSLCIVRMGMDAGWLDTDGNVAAPPIPKLDS
jgi:hypothetical protein